MAIRSQRITSILKKFIQTLEQHRIQVDCLILYGSYARGDQRPDSDIDVAVISSSFNRINILRRQELLGEIIYPLDAPIEALGYSIRDYNKRTPFGFLSYILSEGKIIYRHKNFPA